MASRFDKIVDSVQTEHVPIPSKSIPVLTLIFSVTTCLFILATFIGRLEIYCNDDTYVYFTYAKNFVQGRFFAYDLRNIPSEGFTSIFYLFMLVPFELAGVNMMFATAVLSIMGFLTTAILALAMLYRNDFLSKKESLVYAPLLLALLLLNNNALKQAGWGLETAWGFLFVLAAVACLCEILKSTPECSSQKGRWTAGFFLSLFFSLLCRPENALYVSLLCLYGFRYHPKRRVFFRGMGNFAVLLLVYASWKFLFFHDLFPTAYYRKVAIFDTGFLPGLSYLFAFFRNSPVTICAVILGIIIYLVHSLQHGGLDQFVRNNHALVLLVLCGAVNALLVIKILPQIGFGFRFLFTLQCVLAILLCWLAVRLAALIAKRFSGSFPIVSSLVPLGVVLFLLFLVAWYAVPNQYHTAPLIERLDLLKRANLAVEQHHYVRFGRFLREKLPNHEGITVVFGDAGAIPYEFQCRFIDANGLTEPYVARLFQEKDPDVRAAKYARYILEQEPDIIVLNFGDLERDLSVIRPNLQSPFGREMRLAVWEAFKNDGFRYLVSLPMYYDLHIGVNPRSPYIGPIAKALDAYALANGGYRNPGGLTVSLKNQKVHFDAYIASDGH